MNEVAHKTMKALIKCEWMHVQTLPKFYRLSPTAVEEEAVRIDLTTELLSKGHSYL